jgi:hypothetical protein
MSKKSNQKRRTGSKQKSSRRQKPRKTSKNSKRKAISKTKFGKCQSEVMKFVMEEFKNGKLKQRNGETVSNRKQAVAIGLSKSGKKCNKSLTSGNLKLLTKQQLLRKFRNAGLKSYMTKSKMLNKIKHKSK